MIPPTSETYFHLNVCQHRLNVSQSLSFASPLLREASMKGRSQVSLDESLSMTFISDAALHVFDVINNRESSRELAWAVADLTKEDAKQLCCFFKALQGASSNEPLVREYFVLFSERATRECSSFKEALECIKAGEVDVRCTGFSLVNTEEGYLLRLSSLCNIDEVLACLSAAGISPCCIHWDDRDNYSTHIDNLDWLENFPGVEKIYITSYQLTSFEGLKYCKKLKELSLKNSFINNSLAVLENASELKTIILDCTSYQRGEKADYGFFSHLNLLENLSMRHISLTSLEFLANLPKLVSLNLDSCAKGRMSYFWNDLKACPHLQSLTLRNCNIRNLDWIRDMEDLVYLACQACPMLVSLEALAARKLPLVMLDLEGCEKISPEDWENFLAEKRPEHWIGPSLIQTERVQAETKTKTIILR